MTTYSLGRISIVWKGDYNASTTYEIQDAVNYNGSTYVCVTASTTGVTPVASASQWDLAAQGMDSVATTTGDIIYYNNNQLNRLPAGTAGQVLMVDNGLPAWKDYQTRSSHHVAIGGLQYYRSMSYRKGFCIMTDGSMRCWGDAGANQLGIGNTTSYDRSFPSLVAFPKGHPGCAVHDQVNDRCKWFCTYGDAVWSIDNNGQLWGWGQQPNYGELGTGNTTVQNVPYAISADTANSINGKTVIQLATFASTEENHGSMMVLCSDGSLHAAGYNGHGQLGIGNASHQNRFLEINSAVLSGVSRVIGTRDRYTAYFMLKSNGELYHTGYNGHYQSGNNSTSDNVSPFRIPYFYDNSIVVTNIWCTAYQNFALDNANNLYAWGANDQGTTGAGNYIANIQTPIKVLEGVSSCSVTAWDYTVAYAIMTDGTVRATGNGDYGALANESVTDHNTWTPMRSKDNVLNGVTITKVIANGTGSYNSVMLMSNAGKIYSVGYNGKGQLGLGDTTARNLVEEVPIQGYVVDIGPVGYSTEGGYQILLDDGQLYQTGYAGDSQLPEDDDEYSSTAYPIIL